MRGRGDVAGQVCGARDHAVDFFGEYFSGRGRANAGDAENKVEDAEIHTEEEEEDFTSPLFPPSLLVRSGDQG